MSCTEDNTISPEIPYGFCHCGCNQKTKIATKTDASTHRKKGLPMKFILGHNGKGSLNARWKNGRSERGIRTLIHQPSHPNAHRTGYVVEARVIAEKALGKTLKITHPVHHHTSTELVVCENQAYHMLIHARTRAYYATGNANHRKCPYCKQWDDPSKMVFHKSKTSNGHYEHCGCANNAARIRKQRLSS